MIPIISINKLLEHLLPVVFKDKVYTTSNSYQWLIALSYPIKVIYNDFKEYRNKTLYDLQHTGQVLSLEHQLNDYYSLPFPIDIISSIWVEDGERKDEYYIFNNGIDANTILNDTQVYVFNSSEELNVGFEQPYLYLDIELIVDNIDFIVHVPIAITNLDYIKTILNTYKLAGYSYSIVSY